MRTLIVEDDFVARSILKNSLSPYSDCDIAVDGEEALQAFNLAWEENKPYDLICLDIMMPKMDGQAALKKIREHEDLLSIHKSKVVKVIMITALSDPKNVVEAYHRGGAASYLVKPIDRSKLIQEIKNFGLIS